MVIKIVFITNVTEIHKILKNQCKIDLNTNKIAKIIINNNITIISKAINKEMMICIKQIKQKMIDKFIIQLRLQMMVIIDKLFHI